MKTCFVSMPLGVRKRPYSDLQIDFDAVFDRLIVPAAADAELRLVRWGTGGSFTQRDALRAIISSDVLLADVSSLNPNVMYELGIRHAANQGPTVIVAVEGEVLPFYVSYIRAFFYDAQNPENVRTHLASAFRLAARRSDGSPLYEFFPGLHVQLPPELNSEEWQKRRSREGEHWSSVGRRTRNAGSGASSQREVEMVEAAIRSVADVEPAGFIDMLKGYRDAGDWDRVIHAGLSPPPALAGDPSVQQLVAFALAQRRGDGDEERALAMMRGLLDEIGPDAETIGIMGRIYKSRYKRSDGSDEDSLRNAIKHYRQAFELQPNDIYAGYNAVTLSSLVWKGDKGREDVGELLPRVQRVFEERLAVGEVSYSLLTAAVELAVIERNWDQAWSLTAKAVELKPTNWLRDASIESLQRLGRGMKASEQDMLNDVISRLSASEWSADGEE